MKNILIFIAAFAAYTSLASANQDWNTLTDKYNLKKSGQTFCTKGALGHLQLNGRKRVRPASISKLFTTLWAIEKLNKDYKFKTNFYIDDNKTLYVLGSKDPFFVTESILYVLDRILNDSINIKKIVFDKNFYFNWKSEPEDVLNKLKSYFVIRSKDKEVKKVQKLFNERGFDIKISEILNSIESIQFQSKINTKYLQKVFTFNSHPLYKIIKQMNKYSNNFIADIIFNNLGGEKAFNIYLNKKLNISNKTTYLYTGSGLGDNYTTCFDTIRVLEELINQVNKQSIHPYDIIAVPTSDNGTLKNRLSHFEKSMVAKTGTLNGTVTLGGLVFTDKGYQFFTLFNEINFLSKGRSFQDEFLNNYFLSTSHFDYEEEDYFPVVL